MPMYIQPKTYSAILSFPWNDQYVQVPETGFNFCFSEPNPVLISIAYIIILFAMKAKSEQCPHYYIIVNLEKERVTYQNQVLKSSYPFNTQRS